MKVIYLSGPMTLGHQFDNVREAMRHATLLREAGHAVILPQLNYWWEMVFPGDLETYMSMDLALLERADVVVRIPGESQGADREVAHASLYGIPTFIGTAEAWLAEQAKAA